MSPSKTGDSFSTLQQFVSATLTKTFRLLFAYHMWAHCCLVCWYAASGESSLTLLLVAAASWVSVKMKRKACCTVLKQVNRIKRINYSFVLRPHLTTIPPRSLPCSSQRHDCILNKTRLRIACQSCVLRDAWQQACTVALYWEGICEVCSKESSLACRCGHQPFWAVCLRSSCYLPWVVVSGPDVILCAFVPTSCHANSGASSGNISPFAIAFCPSRLSCV